MSFNKKEYNKIWRMKNKDRIRASMQRYRATEKGRITEGKAVTRWVKRKRERLIALLGNQCSCIGIKCWHMDKCNITDLRVLQIDHIKGGGNKQRKEMGGQHAVYDYYFNNPSLAKEDVQILCANCNWMKRYHNNEVTYSQKL